RDICPECFSRDTDWIHSSGRGTLHTFCIANRGPTPAFRDRAPFVCAIVELEEGPRMPTSLVDVQPDPAAIKVGMALEVVFDDLNENISLPKFRPAS
ncbi:MAG: OB-fold domain-containing protein, partial [Dehalococcoidia bacterium]|nr:OB-fold domain-containing protein [Dehalococcoidia bacterium]